MKIIGIDPSIENTGICVLNNEKIEFSWKIGASPGKHLPKRLDILRYRWNHLSYKFLDAHIIIEQPEKQASLKGQHAYETNNLVVLCAVFGYLLALSSLLTSSSNIHCFTPSQWKGNLPKAITRKRMERKYGDLSKLSDDEVDALGLADYYQCNYGK